jgi:hypothetical protein
LGREGHVPHPATCRQIAVLDLSDDTLVDLIPEGNARDHRAADMNVMFCTLYTIHIYATIATSALYVRDQLMEMPKRATDRAVGSLNVTSRVDMTKVGKGTAEIVEGVLVGYRISSE